MKVVLIIVIVNFCREIVAYYSRTSLQLSHSGGIGSLRLNMTLPAGKIKEDISTW